MVQALRFRKKRTQKQVYKLDSCPSLDLATPELLASEPNHFCILWALISFSEKEEETTHLKTTEITFIQITWEAYVKFRFLGVIADSLN